MLLQKVEEHIKRHRMAPSRFGREAVGDPKFVFDLRDGREVRSRTARRVLDYLHDNTPEQF
jgi:2,4-dienoyl-CoA reductase-like NADH-dependent reductase (Old Yellow Enzyme family)